MYVYIFPFSAERVLIYSTPEDTSISVLPFFHIYGMMPVMSVLLRNGTKLVTIPKFDPEMYLNLIQKYKVSG
jgi:acyl-CoA synthetase (AMP-forming)/AMP-acid ligase II